MTPIDILKWRYATKRFDVSKKIDPETLGQLKDAMQLAPSSVGLQPYVIIEITDADVRKSLQDRSMNQPAITEASNLFIFCNMTTVDKEYVENHLKRIQQERKMNDEQIAPWRAMMDGYILGMSPTQQNLWSAEDTYLAAGFALAACAMLKVDACPIGGFDAVGYDEILDLSEQGLNPALVLPVGYRSADDTYQHLAKVRKPKSELFRTI
ncbi:MAG: NAD(P)H-dependent oxidoreductase [Marinifilaceae bacterium]